MQLHVGSIQSAAVAPLSSVLAEHHSAMVMATIGALFIWHAALSAELVDMLMALGNRRDAVAMRMLSRI